MSQESIMSSYDVKNSKTGHIIPVVNSVHLHSVYNPIKEAESFVSKHDETLNKKNNILILGLGFGYHVNEIVYRLKRYHGENFKIFIIEPNQRVYQDFQDNFKNLDHRVTIICDSSPENLYTSSELIHFLASTPALIPHNASFNLYYDYYKKFLTYTASNNLHEIAKLVDDNHFEEYFLQQNADWTLDILFQKIKERGIESNEEFALLAFESLTKEQPSSGKNL